tara:strand:- start:175 stop:546 length:372 start_codon:yes stop_codon:yes gene_type:complete
MKYNINNGLSLVCIILLLILVLCFLRYYSLKKEQFNNSNEESLFNNKLTKEFERKFNYRHDCSGGAFKQKMLDYFKGVKKYRQLENKIRQQNDEMKLTYDEYRKSMLHLDEAKQNLDYCVQTV